jgi:hypothetical protein
VADLTLIAAAFTASGQSGFGQELTGGGAELPLGYITGNTMTIEHWVKPVPADLTGTVLITSQQDSWWVGFVDGKLTTKHGDTANKVTFTAAAASSTGVYIHVAYVFGPSGTKLFLDGQLVGSDPNEITAIGSEALGAKKLYVREGHNASSSFNLGGAIDELAIFTTEKYTTAFTPPTVPYVGNETGLANLYHLDSTGTDSQGTTVVKASIPANDSAILYSPYNWKVTATNAKTINAGAYFRTFFTGGTCELVFDTSGLAGDTPRIKAIIDGNTTTVSKVGASVVLTMPSGQSNIKHLLEVFVDATSPKVDRWMLQQNAVKLVSIELDNGEGVLPVPSRTNKILYLGDSITEGNQTLQSVAGDSVATTNNSATASWALESMKMTNSESGVVGFGGQGILDTGNGNVPAFNETWDYLWDGEARDFTDEPDMCIWAQGTNDGTANTVSAGLAILNLMLTAMPNTKFILMRPFLNDNQAANLQTIATTCNEPERVFYVDTTGVWNSSDSVDALHPYGYTCLADIAPFVADEMTTVLSADTYPTQVVTLSITGVPDGTHDTRVVDVTTGRLILIEQVAWASGSATVNVPIDLGSTIEYYEIISTEGGLQRGVVS